MNYATGEKYDGNWRFGKREGYGVLTWPCG